MDRKKYLREYQRVWVKRRRMEWIEANGPCVKCGSTVDLEMDHIDPATKEHHAIWSWAKERREAELAKCQVLCGRCHEDKHSAPHGTATMYDKGCKCDLCRAANTEKVRKYRQRYPTRRLIGLRQLPPKE
jgi:5-methylcytosine-specific restriction endonuclease McrA